MPLLLFFITFASGSDQIYLQYCLKSKSEASSALKRIYFLKTANDYLGQDGACLDITTSSHRKFLYDKVMRSKFGVTSDQVNKESRSTCNFEIKRVSHKNSKNIGSSIGTSGAYLAQNDFKNNSTTITSLSAQEGKAATINVNDQSVDIICHKTSLGFNVDIVINGLDSSLKTSRYLTRGSTIELGSVTKSINKNNSNFQASNTIANKASEKGHEFESVYLSVK